MIPNLEDGNNYRHRETKESLLVEDSYRRHIENVWDVRLEKIKVVNGYTPEWKMYHGDFLIGICEFKDRSVSNTYSLGEKPIDKTVNIDFGKFEMCLAIARSENVPLYMFFKFVNGLYFSKHVDYADVEKITDWGRTDRNDPLDICKFGAAIKTKRFKLVSCPDCEFSNYLGRDFCPDCDNVLAVKC